MLFNSYEFIFIFLPITFLGYFILGKRNVRLAIVWMVVASLFFYGWWDYHYVPLLLGSIWFNYFVGQRIAHHNSKRAWLIFGIVCDLLLLGYYKYDAFFVENLNVLLHTDWPVNKNILPLGISFFTFTQSAYLIDAYRGETKKDDIYSYLEFVTVFPHLIAGPIINHKEMIPQFLCKDNYQINYENIAKGLTLFVMGLFKKVVIADSFAVWVNEIFAKVSSLNTLEAWIGAISYSFQLYFDFSGYSEMAIGLALMFNLQFPTNFNSPYQANNIIDFWRRWHMTLGVWVKNYLYIPLGGNRVGRVRQMFNLFFSMLLIGFWHGAGWNFIFWGGMHGTLLVINHCWRQMNLSMPKYIGRVLTFVCVMVAWIFFRAETFHEGWLIVVKMLDWHNVVLPAGTSFAKHLGFLANYGVTFDTWQLTTSLTRIMYSILIGGLLVVIVPNPQLFLQNFKPNWRWVTASLVFLLVSIMMMTRVSDFLYFQF